LLSIDIKIQAVWAGLVVMLTPFLTPHNMTKVSIEVKGHSLRLRWRYEGKRKQLALGVKDTPTGRAFANQKIAQIEMDLVSGNYDPTLLKYKPRKLGKNPTEITAVELFRRWANFYAKDRALTVGSAQRFNAIAAKLSHFLNDAAAHKVTELVARDVVARWSEDAADRTVKSYLYYLQACWDWAKGKYHLTEVNPWSTCLDRLKKRSNPTPSQHKAPFTIPELQAIIAAFANHPQYKHYQDFVVFLCQSACRPGEAAGLRWKSIGPDFSTAWIGESISRGDQNQRGTKTGKSRTIQLTPNIRSMLADRFDRLKPQPDDLVFPSPKGHAIDDHNFNRRAWKTILGICQIEYRRPYNLRHSAISHALHNGANPIALAEQTGHDKRVLLSTYAHAIDRECLFVDFN
jgi:integrase